VSISTVEWTDHEAVLRAIKSMDARFNVVMDFVVERLQRREREIRFAAESLASRSDSMTMKATANALSEVISALLDAKRNPGEKA
jgi:tRNA pseudouridine-54 N-methylase